MANPMQGPIQIQAMMAGGQSLAQGINPGPPGPAGQPSAQPGQSGQQPQQEPQKLDSVSKVKTLLWPLKESLATCMRVAGANISYNASVDAGAKDSEQQPARFDKYLEDFYAICDQIELNLKVALDCSSLTSSSQRYTLLPVVANKPDIANTTDPQSYNQLISTVKIQVSHATEIHDSLTEAARTINNNE